MAHMGELLSALCPSHYHRASEGVNKEALKVLNRGLTCDSLPPLQSESIVNSICTNMSHTAAFVLFILTILFGVFTNKHMQEVDND